VTAGLRLGALFCVVSLACAAPPWSRRTSPAPSARDARVALSATAQQIVEQTNRERVEEHLRPLAIHPLLVAAAQLQAEQMARYGVMAHDIPRAPYPTLKSRLAIVGFDWADAAENVAKNYGTGASAVGAWMRSHSHRVNILDSAFTHIGAGFAVDDQGNRYYAQVFGRPRRR
jgi:uncharacterized protein YkwD